MRASHLAASLAGVFLSLIAAPLHSEVLVRISDEVYTHQVVEAGCQVWAATDSGAYRVDGDSLTPVLTDLAVLTIAEVNEKIWFGSEEGIFEFSDDTANPIYRDSIREPWITVVRTVGDIVWVGTSDGLFRIEDGVPLPTPIEENVYSIEVRGNRLWIGTSKNAYWFDDLGTAVSPPLLQAAPKPIFEKDLVWVSEIIGAGGYTWLITNRDLGLYGPCFLVDGDDLREVLRDYQVISLAQIGNETWFATTRGVLRLSGGSPGLFPLMGPAETVNTISEIDSEVWLGTTEGVYYRNKAGLEKVAAKNRLNVKGIDKAAGRIWAWGDRGVYRIEAGRNPRDAWLIGGIVGAFGVCLIFLFWKFKTNVATSGYDPPAEIDAASEAPEALENAAEVANAPMASVVSETATEVHAAREAPEAATGIAAAPEASEAAGDIAAAPDSPEAPLQVKKNRVFISYSRDDVRWAELIVSALKPMMRDGVLEFWWDAEIKPGKRWDGTIKQALAESKAALLLVSRHFWASDYIAQDEYPAILKAEERGELGVLWLPVSASLHKRTDLEKFQAVFDRPLDQLTAAELEEALVKICERIIEVLEELADEG